ncbi:hypothetical protein VNO80_23164 [Phaseolus coccineus]|uniref:Cystatin domain-containing protein n=1 Tax=Phaseolus coccineus TaxID=3886 RepID=A0AAN9QUQ6_PHACN
MPSTTWIRIDHTAMRVTWQSLESVRDNVSVFGNHNKPTNHHSNATTRSRCEAPSNLTTCTATNFPLVFHTSANNFPSSLLYKRHRMLFRYKHTYYRSMAALIRSPAVRLALLLVLACVLCGVSHGGLAGGKTEIADVKMNKDVQDLGRFSVEEHNRRVREERGEEAEEEVTFVEVVEAQQQVVSGIKYYLKISANQSGGRDSRTFHSVVVVKPWLRSSQLLNFTPSPP